MCLSRRPFVTVVSDREVNMAAGLYNPFRRARNVQIILIWQHDRDGLQTYSGTPIDCFTHAQQVDRGAEDDMPITPNETTHFLP